MRTFTRLARCLPFVGIGLGNLISANSLAVNHPDLSLICFAGAAIMMIAAIAYAVVAVVPE